MKVEPVPFKKFFKNKETIYKNIMLVAKRARQIIDKRYVKIEAMQNIEDTEQLIEIEDDDFEQTKSISLAMDELLENNIGYSNTKFR
jgi:DNA-directed RNA polymerase subunit K/omega